MLSSIVQRSHSSLDQSLIPGYTLCENSYELLMCTLIYHYYAGMVLWELAQLS